MSLVLNTNYNSLNAQRNLSTSQAALSQSLQRLSSGLRINSAADDAAGLAIASRFTTQINGTSQAINNANDAVSEAQTAGGALATLTNSLQSIRSLAVEAANGSNSASDRQALDQQVQQQIAEITQIASQTSFNGSNVLDGSSGVTTFQVGSNVGNTISINLTQGVRADQIGQTATSKGTGIVGTTALTAGNLTVAVGIGAATSIGASVSTAVTGTTTAGQNAGSAYAKAAAISAADISGLTATATNSITGVFTNIVGATAGTAGSGVGAGPGGAGGASTYGLSINGQAIYSGANNVAAGTTLTQAQVATQINLYSSQDGGVTATVGANGITLAAADGQDISVNQSTIALGAAGTAGAGATAGTAGAAATGTGFGTVVAGATAGTAQVNTGSVTLSANSNIVLAGTDTTNIGQASGIISLNTNALSGQNVLTVTGANATISAVDAALQTVSAFNSQLGAIQNRFTAAVSNLTSTSQNLSQARSTLQDTNFAAETANLTQSNVLEQAGISVLAQANQQPQLILKLLQ
jgi:flagellin